MNGQCINAELATGTPLKLYRFHYNLRCVVPVNWPVMKRRITGNQAAIPFRQWNRLNQGMRLAS